MVTFFLCDDNEIIMEKFSRELSGIAEMEKLSISIRTFDSGESLLFELSDNPNAADVILLDVLMKKINGIDTAKELRRLGCIAEIVFLTSSEEFVFDSFDTNPFYYLLKNDASSEKFKSLILKVYKVASDKTSKIFHCEFKGDSKVIPCSSILYFEVNNRTVTVHYGGETFSFYSSMDSLLTQLDKNDFIRTHRSFLVNIKHIKGVGKSGATLSNGEIVPVSDTYSKDMRVAIMKYYDR